MNGRTLSRHRGMCVREGPSAEIEAAGWIVSVGGAG
jgi:hypothetical protein